MAETFPQVLPEHSNPLAKNPPPIYRSKTFSIALRVIFPPSASQSPHLLSSVTFRLFRFLILPCSLFASFYPFPFMLFDPLAHKPPVIALPITAALHYLAKPASPLPPILQPQIPKQQVQIRYPVDHEIRASRAGAIEVAPEEKAGG